MSTAEAGLLFMALGTAYENRGRLLQMDGRNKSAAFYSITGLVAKAGGAVLMAVYFVNGLA